MVLVWQESTDPQALTCWRDGAGARKPLWMYPGDDYRAVTIIKRRKILLPANAHLRKGKPAGGGVDLATLATTADSMTGEDTVYGTGGWLAAQMPFITGTPDVDHDTGSTPDIWAMAVDVTSISRGDGPNHGRLPFPPLLQHWSRPASQDKQGCTT